MWLVNQSDYTDLIGACHNELDQFLSRNYMQICNYCGIEKKRKIPTGNNGKEISKNKTINGETKMRENVFNQVKTKIVEILEDETLVLQDDTKIAEIGMNSISFIKLLVFVEDLYDIEFDDNDLNLQDYIVFGDIVNKICEMKNE